jgi:hypothetical protein
MRLKVRLDRWRSKKDRGFMRRRKSQRIRVVQAS